MSRYIKIFYWGFIISFLGTLPLGTMNVTATNISLQKGELAAYIFSIGTEVVELACLFIVLQAMQWVARHQKYFIVFEWVTAALILTLAISCFISAVKMKAFGHSVFTQYNLPPFVLGMLLSVLNPLHIPFWFGWSTVLLEKKILIPQQKYFMVYMSGTVIGTIAGFSVFIFGGNYLVSQLSDKQNILNWIVGFVLLITVIIQLYKMYKKSKQKNNEDKMPVIN